MTTVKNMNDKSTEQTLEELAELRRQHQMLDENLSALALKADSDQLEMTRLKKRKLKLKDQIEKLRSSLIPDRHA